MLEQKDLIINSIVFKEDLEAGLSQVDLLEQVQAMGFNRFEVRREFLGDIPQELGVLKAKANQLDIALFYSVNEDLLVDGRLNPSIDALLQEAQVLQAPFLKVNIGDANRLLPQTLSSLEKVLPPGMPLLVENNQDPVGASLANCVRFMTLAQQTNLPIGFVFDTANWAFVGESIVQAAKQLTAFTSYLHCKNYLQVGEVLSTSNALFEGEIDIIQLLQQFPNVPYLALEYATSKEQLLADASRLSQLL
ncbi:sugar phosphate isomerase/epimerase family protein [Streptococcus catagoni]|uniref:sugar phosphate isomerase/epimerase family protein n=1 Tax=Streptococcus catagoni TaxID=2654874 RepID=UPI00140C0AC2|nr:AP endonuclease [Streptococcus catagoni]